MDDLCQPLGDDTLRLEPLVEAHREGLRAACNADTEIWEIYPFSFYGDAFDGQFDRLLRRDGRFAYAIIEAGNIVGMTAWIATGLPGHSVEIGNSYIIPARRGSGLNRRYKTLMLNHAFANAYKRVVFKVDEINARSQAAVLKLGATKEGVMRAERVTWTGRLRDTGLFSILCDELPVPRQ
jgi:RimJ/RimL family protein N-acetyltransferase